MAISKYSLLETLVRNLKVDFQSQTAIFIYFSSAYLKVGFVDFMKCILTLWRSLVLWEKFKIDYKVEFSQFVYV